MEKESRNFPAQKEVSKTTFERATFWHGVRRLLRYVGYDHAAIFLSGSQHTPSKSTSNELWEWESSDVDRRRALSCDERDGVRGAALTQAEARCCSTIVNDEKRLSVSTIYFPPKEAVEATTGARPALPEWISDLNQRPQRMTALPAPQ